MLMLPGGTPAEQATDLNSWLTIIGLVEYESVFVDEGYETLQDILILARAGPEALTELIDICNDKVVGGKLSKHKFKHGLKIEVADFYDTHKAPPKPSAVASPASNRSTPDMSDLAFLLLEDPDVMTQISFRRSSRRGGKSSSKKENKPSIPKIVEEGSAKQEILAKLPNTKDVKKEATQGKSWVQIHKKKNGKKTGSQAELSLEEMKRSLLNAQQKMDRTLSPKSPTVTSPIARSGTVAATSSPMSTAATLPKNKEPIVSSPSERKASDA